MPLIVSGGDGTLFHLLQHLRPPFPEIAIAPKGRENALSFHSARNSSARLSTTPRHGYVWGGSRDWNRQHPSHPNHHTATAAVRSTKVIPFLCLLSLK